MSRQDGYWDGGTWVYHADITNDGSNSGNHTYSVVPGAGNELEVLYGRILNGDAAARTSQVLVKDVVGGEILARIVNRSLGAGLDHSFPAVSEAVDSAKLSAGARIIIAGLMELQAVIAAVAVSQDSAFGVVCRIRGGVPTVTLTSPTDAVEVVNRDQVF